MIIALDLGDYVTWVTVDFVTLPTAPEIPLTTFSENPYIPLVQIEWGPLHQAAILQGKEVLLSSSVLVWLEVGGNPILDGFLSRLDYLWWPPYGS